jgi:hypothetical protein
MKAAHQRVKKYRSEGGAADLARVEVLVPPSAREEILAVASRLRAEHPSDRPLILLSHLDVAAAERQAWLRADPAGARGRERVRHLVETGKVAPEEGERLLAAMGNVASAVSAPTAATFRGSGIEPDPTSAYRSSAAPFA